ncbi:MAG: bifunctional folylpolyglutamate synthase/dihydrofolate synthase [bacterium LCO1.1]|uniref:tetrahydrofolate synthase n=1 Tax=Candidatus Weimeria bifida TaxID=2599074 RepID=A0A6N7IZ09_9FIRM|nr:bifunctional folylpolyglutamate synthase/dihydrofolate synthase [Candidatus Weimeria bifida]
MYTDLVQKIESLKRFGNKSGREVTERLLPELGSPDRGMKIIHIAGTNGKGSTAVYIAAGLQANGYKTGLFTSPHLITIRERMQIDREMIGRDDFTRLAGKVLSVGMPEEYTPTFFDICLATALLWFKENNCDYVVLETGLGGRLDSTRGISETPVAGTITAIGLDHTAILGDTLEKIAAEKAGIEREGMPVVIAHNKPSVRKVLEKNASSFLAVDKISDTDERKTNGLFSLALKARDRDKEITPPLEGDFQYDNLAAALFTLYLTAPDLDKDKVISGIRTVTWPARIEELSDDPLFIVDGSHNPQGVEALSRTLREAHPGMKFVFLMAAMADKDVSHMIEGTKDIAEYYICTKADTPRSLEASRLTEMVRSHGAKAVCAETLEKALEFARGSGAPVVSFGSLYLAGEVLKAYRD